VKASRLIGNSDLRKQPNQYGFSESDTSNSSPQTVPGTDDDDAVTDSPTPTRGRPVSTVPPKAFPPNIQSSSLVFKRPMPVRQQVTGERAAAGAGASTDALVQGTPPGPKSAMKLLQTPNLAGKRRKIIHTGETARNTAMTQVGGTPKPRVHGTGRIYMSGQRFVSDVQIQLDLKKQQLLTAPLVRTCGSAFRPSLLGPRDKIKICCALFKFDCTNPLSDASFCCGGKPTPVLQVHSAQFRCLLHKWSLSFVNTSTTAMIFVMLLQLNSPAFVSPFFTTTTQDAPPRIALRPTPVRHVPQPIETMLGLANYQLVSQIPLGQGTSTSS